MRAPRGAAQVRRRPCQRRSGCRVSRQRGRLHPAGRAAAGGDRLGHGRRGTGSGLGAARFRVRCALRPIPRWCGRSNGQRGVRANRRWHDNRVGSRRWPGLVAHALSGETRRDVARSSDRPRAARYAHERAPGDPARAGEWSRGRHIPVNPRAELGRVPACALGPAVLDCRADRGRSSPCQLGDNDQWRVWRGDHTTSTAHPTGGDCSASPLIQRSTCLAWLGQCPAKCSSRTSGAPQE